MARQEQDREDLLREATALVPRGELRLEGFSEPVVIGFRGRAGSMYLGSDPALHFSPDNRLRRGFVDGLLLKAQEGQLVQMRRVRTQGEVQLQSRPLTHAEQDAMLSRVEDWIRTAHHSLSTGRYEVIGQAPEDGQIVAAASHWLGSLLTTNLSVAEDPGLLASPA